MLVNTSINESVSRINIVFLSVSAFALSLLRCKLFDLCFISTTVVYVMIQIHSFCVTLKKNFAYPPYKNLLQKKFQSGF